MKIYCGDYWEWNPPKRFPWRKLAIIALCVVSTTAAVPAVIDYYWKGQDTSQALSEDEALLIVQDRQVVEPMRRGAAGMVFISAKRAIRALQNAQRDKDQVASDATLYLQKLATQLRQ